MSLYCFVISGLCGWIHESEGITYLLCWG